MDILKYLNIHIRRKREGERMNLKLERNSSSPTYTIISVDNQVLIADAVMILLNILIVGLT